MSGIKPTYAIAGTKLFRFMSASTQHFKQSIAHLMAKNEIFLASRRSFNDPFDMHPILMSDWTTAGIRQHMRNLANDPSRAHPEVAAKIRSLGPLDPKLISGAELQGIRKAWPRYMNQLLDNVGVCCFTEGMQNPLFWAHYANSYMGVCVEFAATGDTTQLFCNCMKVNYSKDRPVVRASQSGALATVYGDQQDWDHVIQYGFCTKSVDGAVEKEWRVWGPGLAKTYQRYQPKH